MPKRSFLYFTLFAAALVVAVPLWAFGREGSLDAPSAAAEPGDEQAKELFVTNCGSCHTMEAAGTDGIVGPNLDDLLGVTAGANDQRVLTAITNGVEGRMPADILRGRQATIVSDYVNRVAGE